MSNNPDFLNAICNCLMEAMIPRIDERIKEHLAKMPDPLNGEYVTGEEFREFEARVERLEESKVDQSDLEDKVNQAVSEADFSDEIESKVKDIIDYYDFDDAISDYIRENDIPNEEEVRNILNAESGEFVDRKLQESLGENLNIILRKIGEALLHTSDMRAV